MTSVKQLAGKVGGLTSVAKHGPHAVAAPARRGFIAKFLREVDPDNILPQAEREARAQAALRAHMTRLQLGSARARKQRRAS